MGILIPSEGGGSLGELVYIGGVAYFNQSTKPTERSAGVPLVVRDRWYDTDDGTEWFWNGTYWLTQELYGAAFGLTASWGTSDTRSAAKAFTVNEAWSGVFFEQFSVHFLNQFSVPWDANNYSTFAISVTGIGGGSATILTFTENNRTLADVSSVKVIKAINYYKSLEAGADNGGNRGFRDILVTTTKVGSGSNVLAQEYITYRGVAP